LVTLAEEEAMRAASYIGRVGGLAVALGVGTAVFTGAGVAHATEGDDSGTGAPAGQEQGATNTTTQDTDSGGLGKIDLKLPRLSDIIGRHRADGTTPSSNTATSIVKRLNDAAKRVTDAIENAADADNTVVRSTTNTGGSSLQDRRASRTERTGAEAPSVDTLTDGGGTQTNNIVSSQFANGAAAVKDWITSPRALAGRTVDLTPTISAPTPLWTPPQILAPFGTMKATPGTGVTAVRTTLLTSVLGVVNPFAGNSPGSPVGVDPLSAVFAGAARREVGVESFTPTALLATSSNSLTYDPDIDLVHGVITGCNGVACGITKDGVQYLVVSQPSGGGKVYVDPTTGDFTYLPDLASVQSPNATETFKVVAAETTAFTSAIVGVPLIGGLASQVLVVLYQVPVVNVLLSPIIGKSEITDISLKVSDFKDSDDLAPIAFTTKIPSPKDGTLIRINYFPAYQVADDDSGQTTAPTILNGPGLATAGNIDPNAPSIVDGLVPGLNFLRDPAAGGGYNVVTWDPRGEFDSGGTLQLDSPEYEGVDVTGIIDFLSAGVNQPLVKQQFDTDSDADNNAPYVPGDVTDPAIGMVGGSYGGGIQLATASIDKRVDVIVPGIAWNSLDDALYPDQAFKTSYASLLLLGLVTTGSRINPQIYAGIITGDVLGILTESQRALLLRSSPGAPPPDGYIGDITAPALFIQGTVDVLFPLDQALANAAGIGTTDPDDVKMIWYCGGHGVCLTMDQTQLDDQETRLRDNTFDFLGAYLKGGNIADMPKFQYVDQLGVWHTADVLPNDGAFYGDSEPIDASQADGGLLGIVPILGGTGPQSAAGFPASLGLGTPAKNAITVPIHATPSADGTNTYVVGSPHLTFDYSGVGTTRHVYAQIVDKNTGLVVGNIVTPVSVTLDGTHRTADVDMENVAWTYTDATGDPDHPSNYDDLELQITSSATAFEDFTSFGAINISNVNVSLPTAGAGVVDPEDELAEQLAV
jgi:ABC-2 type transport system ATP-binding protein